MLCTLLALTASVAPIAAHDARPVAPFAPSARVDRPSGVHVDVGNDGAIWVRGETYKARFDADGVTYIPFLGSAAPRNWPVTFRFVAARAGGVDLELSETVAPTFAPSLDGDRVVVDRGAIDEVWILRPDSIEQTFVVEERHAAGLELVVDVESELDGRANGGAFEFVGALGGVRYSEAFVVDGGTRRAIPSRFDGGSIRIAVPASEFDAVPLPLVVDPVITTFSVDTSSADTFNADIAWDEDTQRAFVVMQEVFSATDHDVYSELLNATGGQISTAYADMSTEDWRTPSCANLPHADQFCVVASIGAYPGNAFEVIGGRSSGASSLIYGPKFLISTAESPVIAPDIGADSRNSAAARYCVVFTFGSGANRYTGWKTIDRTGAIGTSTYHPNVATNSRAVISSSTNDQYWVLADMVGTPGATQVHAWTVDVDGSTITNPVAVGLTGDITQLSAASPLDNGRLFLAWRSSDGLDDDVIVSCLAPTITTSSRYNLADLEGRSSEVEDQRHVALASDGEKVIAIYAESAAGGLNNFDIRITSLYALGYSIGASEAHVAVSTSTLVDQKPEIVSAYSTAGQSEFFPFVWERQTVLLTSDVYAGSYIAPPGGPIEAYCFGDTTGTACPCGNIGAPGRGCPSSVDSSGALLAANGIANPSNDTLVLSASHMPTNASCLFFQGTAATAGGGGSVFGDGLRCASGTVLRLGTKTSSGGVAIYPGAGDSSVSVRGLVPALGGRRYYQAWYRNAASFCTASTFNLTNGLEVTWLP